MYTLASTVRKKPEFKGFEVPNNWYTLVKETPHEDVYYSCTNISCALGTLKRGTQLHRVYDIINKCALSIGFINQ